MKRILLLLLLASITSFAQPSQSKVGTIDIDFILAQMPELSTVQEAVNAYGKELNSELDKKMTAYQKLVNEYASSDATYTINQRKMMQDSIMQEEANLNKYRQNATQLIQLKRDEGLQPLYSKIAASLEKVAQEQGYTQVMERTATLVYIDNNFDLTLAVLKEMGIEVKTEE
jgi:outer membrane protein